MLINIPPNLPTQKTKCKHKKLNPDPYSTELANVCGERVAHSAGSGGYAGLHEAESMAENAVLL